MAEAEECLSQEDLEAFADEFSDDLLPEKRFWELPVQDVERVAEDKIVNLSKTSLKQKYFRVFRRMKEIRRNPYIVLEVINAQRTSSPTFDEQNVRLFGIYKYVPNEHILYSTTARNPCIENPAKIKLNVLNLKACPVIGAHVAIFGELRISQLGNYVIVNFFREIPEEQASEYEYVLRKQLDVRLGR